MDHTYIVRNMEDFPISLSFTDGVVVKLNPGQVFSYTGSEMLNYSILQDMVDNSDVEVYCLTIPFLGGCRDLKVSWGKEGF